MHRVAVDSNYRGSGIAKEMFDQVKNICKQHQIDNIKIDTHHENRPMQRFLKKNGFEPCGTIYLTDGEKRLGFHYQA